MNGIDAVIRNALGDGRLEELFLAHLGWDRPAMQEFSLTVGGDTFTVVPAAQKRGLHLFEIPCEAIPSAAVQAVVDREVSKRSFERILVFCTRTNQVWRWPEARPSGGIRLVPHEYRVASPNEDLVQRVAKLRFTPAEEEGLTLHDVRSRVRLSLNAEQVTKRFYDAFREKHGDLINGIEGIAHEDERSWYASLLMNRLMFIYFLQMKGFIGGDQNFLRTCLNAVKRLRGKDEFYAFYRDLLIPMFHEGFGSRGHAYRDTAIAEILKHVPYLNGGIFEEHPIEQRNPIRVRDDYFERIFGFFDSFTWHLDTSPIGDPNQINPDVLGYVFEQYINLTASGKRENGAYYTKQDVTGYMAGNALLFVLLRRLIERTHVNPFLHLRSSPDLYLHEDMRYGWAQEDERWLPAPESVTSVWAEPDRWRELGPMPRDPELQLPGETWLDVKERRERVDDLRTKIRDGGVASVEALIVENIDLRALLLDTILFLTVPSDVLAAWEETTDTLVLDPTCGSGAFLFAALDVLDDVYAAILETAQSHVDSGSSDAARVLEEITSRRKESQNLAYFRLKHATLNNLYGLDIMSEAVEIAKLRLFLALAARLDRPDEIEPLPDLDFNIKVGNLLVGFRDLEDAQARVAVNFDAYAEIEALVPRVQGLVRERAEFVSLMESVGDDDDIHALKTQILKTTDALRAAADVAYFGAVNERRPFDEWRELARPFHWFVEFPHVVLRGGFDVVVGNPPYVNKREIEYDFAGFGTDACIDIFAPCMERAATLARPGGAYSMIVPIAFQFSKGYAAARQAISVLVPWRCVSTYSRNPSALFTAGLGVRSTIVLGARAVASNCHVTDTRRWTEEYRSHLFHATRYARSPEDGVRPWPRVGTGALSDLYDRLQELPGTLGLGTRRHGIELGFKKTALYYLVFWIDEPPAWLPTGERVGRPAGHLYFSTETERDVAFAMLNGRLGLWWWAATGDDFNVTADMPKSFPIGIDAVAAVHEPLRTFAEALRHEQPKHPIVTLYAGQEMGNYDMLRCRHLTDQIDQLVLDALGLAEYWPELLKADDRFVRMTGERPGTEREWPFPWTPPFEEISHA